MSDRSDFRIIGKVYWIGGVQTFASKQAGKPAFRKRTLILMHGHQQYPKHDEFQATGDRCEDLDRFKEGDHVEIEFSLGGRLRSSGDGCFTGNTIWKIGFAARGSNRETREQQQRGGSQRSNSGGRSESSNRGGPPPRTDEDLFAGGRGYAPPPDDAGPDDDIPF